MDESVRDAIRNGDFRFLENVDGLSDMLTEDRETVMHLAAYDGQLQILRFLLHKFPTLLHARTSKTGDNVLHYAVKSHRLSIVQTVVEFAPDLINLRDIIHETPLQCAIQCGFVWAVETMVHAKPESWYQTHGGGLNLLHLAIANQSSKMVRFIIKACPPTFFASRNPTPLSVAVARPSLGIVQLLFEAEPLTMLQRDDRGYSPVLQARNLEILKYLLQVRPDSIHDTREKTDENLLHVAACRGDENMTEKIELLLKLCPELLHGKDKQGRSVLDAVLRHCEQPTIEKLLYYQPKFVGVDRLNLNTVLHTAVACCSYDIVLRVFEGCQSNLHCANRDNNTPFCFAIHEKLPRVVKMFQPHVPIERAVASRDKCLANCHIDLIVPFMELLNKRMLPCIATIVFDFF